MPDEFHPLSPAKLHFIPHYRLGMLFLADWFNAFSSPLFSPEFSVMNMNRPR